MLEKIEALGLELLIKRFGSMWRVCIFWEQPKFKQIMAQGHRANIVYVEALSLNEAVNKAEERLNEFINKHKEECNDYLRQM